MFVSCRFLIALFIVHSAYIVRKCNEALIYIYNVIKRPCTNKDDQPAKQWAKQDFVKQTLETLLTAEGPNNKKRWGALLKNVFCAPQEVTNVDKDFAEAACRCYLSGTAGMDET